MRQKSQHTGNFNLQLPSDQDAMTTTTTIGEDMFRKIYAKYHQQVSAMACGTYLNEDIQHDIVQNVFTALNESFKKGFQPNDPRHLDAMVIGITTKQIYHSIRDNAIRVRRDKTVSASQVDEFELDHQEWVGDQDQSWEVLEDLLPTLSEKYREVVDMRLQEMSFEDIADKLGISKNLAEVRHHRAVAQLRQAYLRQTAA